MDILRSKPQMAVQLTQVPTTAQVITPPSQSAAKGFLGQRNTNPFGDTRYTSDVPTPAVNNNPFINYGNGQNALLGEVQSHHRNSSPVSHGYKGEYI